MYLRIEWKKKKILSEILVSCKSPKAYWSARNSRTEVFYRKGEEISQNSEVFSCEFCKISKNIFSYKSFLVAASELYLSKTVLAKSIIIDVWDELKYASKAIAICVVRRPIYLFIHLFIYLSRLICYCFQKCKKTKKQKFFLFDEQFSDRYIFIFRHIWETVATFYGISNISSKEKLAIIKFNNLKT